ncbi:MAG: Two component transcriptional regulator, LuxR family [Methylococcaceae bacterium NSP1-1]|nr:MAG: Two component transcriptional regulator, LuxR family [Methylococcaceae bacterium NSP1-1]
MSINKPGTLVYLVDDEFSVRDSLALLIESTGQSVRSFESAEAFLNNYDPEQPGCLLLDVRMPSMSGLELQGELLKREIFIPIIFISGHAGIPDSAKAFRAGAVDFLEKPFDNEILLERIDEAIKKDIVSREQFIEHREIQNRLDHLTLREQEVLSLIVRGHSNKEIAKILDISNRTVEAHRASIMEKMQVKSLAELMVLATHSEMLNDNLLRS